MSERERSPFFPDLPTVWSRPPDFVPTAPPPPTAPAETVVPILDTAISASELAPTGGAEERARADATPPAAAERERLTLLGRVGAAPTARTTPKGTLVARFPLGVRDGEATAWHQVLAFGKRAEQVRDTVHRGDTVEVVGYRHTR